MIDKGGYFDLTELLINLATILAITATAACLFAFRRRSVRRGQLRLIELLVLFAIVGLFAAWWRKHAVQAERAAALEHRYSSIEYTSEEFSGPLWLARLWGRGNLSQFVDVWEVALDGETSPSELPAVVDELRQCDALWLIVCHRGAPAVLREISRLTSVTQIDVFYDNDSKITDTDILQLRAMPNLQQITIHNGQISPDVVLQMTLAGITVEKF